MGTWLQILISGAAVGVLVWLLRPSSASTTSTETAEFINPDDSLQLGMLAGLTGHSIPDAAVMRFALKRFEEQYGRRATTLDIGIVLGLMNSN